MSTTYDVILWDNIGSPYSRALVDKRAIGGSEYALVQLAEAFTGKGLSVLGCSTMRESMVKEGLATYGSFESNDVPGVACETLIVSRMSTWPQHIAARRSFVLAQDQPYGTSYDHFQPIMALGGVFVALSDWHASLFRERYPTWNVQVIHPAVDDHNYVRVSVRKNPNKFVYASAAVKGWEATRLRWVALKESFPELADVELHVTTPGYDHNRITGSQEKKIIPYPPVPPRQLADFMRDAAGLFFVNTFRETFPVVPIIAEAVGCRCHILVESGGAIDAFTSTLNSTLPTAVPKIFDAAFMAAYRSNDPNYVRAPKDFRMSTQIDKWMRLLGLEGGREGRVSYSTPLSAEMLVCGPPLAMFPNEPSPELSMPMRGFIKSRATSYRPSFEKDEPASDEAEKPKQIVPGRRASTSPTASTTTTPASSVTLGLVIIAKDEWEVLPRALDSAREIGAMLAIVVIDQKDARASEVESEVFCGPLFGPHRINYTLAPTPFGGHAAARNEAVEVSFKRDPTTFVLMLDADDTLEGTVGELDPNVDAYEIDILDGTTVYGRLAIFKPNAGFKYERRAHEFLNPPPGARIEKLTTLKMIRGSGGSARKDPYKKYMRDIELLEEDLMDMPNDSRTLFYLGQSYRDALHCMPSDASDLDKLAHIRCANNYYRLCTHSNGWVEEKFVAHLRMGELHEEEASIPGADSTKTMLLQTAKSHYIAAIETVPARWAEAAANLVALWNKEKQFQLAVTLAYAKSASGKGSLPLDIPSGLFVDVSAYHWRLMMEVSVSIYWLGNKEQSKYLTELLLASSNTPEEQKVVLRSNLEFCK